MRSLSGDAVSTAISRASTSGARAFPTMTFPATVVQPSGARRAASRRSQTPMPSLPAKVLWTMTLWLAAWLSRPLPLQARHRVPVTTLRWTSVRRVSSSSRMPATAFASARESSMVTRSLPPSSQMPGPSFHAAVWRRRTSSDERSHLPPPASQKGS